MKEILTAIQAQLALTGDFKYIDEDWGQLDNYGSHIPVQWPACLIDFTGGSYTDIGIDRSASPQNRQQATGSITFNFANLKLTNTSKNAPTVQKDNAWLLLGIIEMAHAKLHGFRPGANCGSLMRASFRRIKRDDGIQHYQVIYTMGLNNV